MNDNVFDATSIFIRRKKVKNFNLEKNIASNMAFRAYCECIGLIAIDMLKKTPYYDKTITESYYNYPSNDIVDVTMQEPVTVTAQNLVNELLQECKNCNIKICISSISFNEIIDGPLPERVALKVRMGTT